MVENPAHASILGLMLSSPVVVGSGLLTDQERNIRRLIASLHADSPAELGTLSEQVVEHGLTVADVAGRSLKKG